MIGKSIKTLIPADMQSEEDTIIERVRSGQRIEHYETVRQRKYGGLVDISLSVSPIKNAQGTIIGASKIARDITERKRDEAQIALLAREAEHRVKNVLATVQATIHLTQADTPDLLKQAIEGRIQALANVHALFVKSRWLGAELRSLVMQEILPYSQAGDSRVRVSGPSLFLETSTAQTIAVALHELTTNAAKYGALSVPEGRVEIAWSHQGRRALHAAMDGDRWSGRQAADAQGFWHPRDGGDGARASCRAKSGSIGAARASSAKSKPTTASRTRRRGSGRRC